MCTLLLARDVLGAGTILIAANRDEDPSRPSEVPQVLVDSPRIIGGRDARAAGTWLAIRGGERPAVAALLNRRPREGASAGVRSRGELPLRVLRAADAQAARAEAGVIAAENAYAPCTLLFASTAACWLLEIPHEGAPRIVDIAPGWHALTHAEINDMHEPRAHFLHTTLRGWHPPSPHTAMARMSALLASHGGGSRPAVCLHEGPVRTVSSSRVWIGANELRYAHVEGRPCEMAFTDQSALLGEHAHMEHA